MPQYLSPGVYVEEVPSAVKPIAGVGTSTAGFIGLVTDDVQTPTQPSQFVHQLRIKANSQTKWRLLPPFIEKEDGNKIRVVLDKDGQPIPIDNEEQLRECPDAYASLPPATDSVTFSAKVIDDPDKGKNVTLTYTVDAQGKASWTAEIQDGSETTKCENIEWILWCDKDNNPMAIHYPLAPAGDPQLVTNWGAFKNLFGDFQSPPEAVTPPWGHPTLAHAVYGFFNNGGTRCWVTRVTNLEKSSNNTNDQVNDALAKFEAIDEIALVAVPMPTSLADGPPPPGGDKQSWQERRANVRQQVLDHCENLQNRFAILDGEETPWGNGQVVPKSVYPSSDRTTKGTDSKYGAIYYPWVDVGEKDKDGNAIYVPPSGHVAGIYARVDTQRGVHKAPANEVVRGALGVKVRISKAQQDGLNPAGINCIRPFNGNVTVWGARTIGGDANLEWKYVNVRRLFLFLRESIDKGTQWVVFEPNTPALWAKITRNVTAFLTNVWQAGALFGDTPEQAFYVKCDAETNPPEVRELGQVVTEVGVAVVKPAEFVIFRISQWAGPGG